MRAGIIGLDAAVALAEASRFLSDSIRFSPPEVIETYFALFRAEKVKVAGAMAGFRDHFSKAF